MKPTVIKCSHCGYESNIISDTCIKCGAKLEKICGNCGASSPVEKNYCDECGKLMQLKIVEEKPIPPPVEEKNVPAIQFETFDEAIEARQKSYADKMAKKAEASAAADADPFTAKKAEETTKEREKLSEFQHKQHIKSREDYEMRKLLMSRPPETFWRKNRIYVYLLFGAAASLFLGYLLLAPYLPRFRLVFTAKKYLFALNSRDYKTAYDFLSVNSRDSCSFTDYVRYNEKQYSGVPSWEFDRVEVYSISPAGAVLKYRVRESGGEWRTDYLSFVLERGRWARPYTRHLFTQVDQAIAEGDFSRALFLSERLSLVDPVDPRAAGYLCNTQYLMRMYDKSVETCRKALEQGKSYPIPFGKDELFWYNFYYADSLMFQGRFTEAVKIYEELSDFEDLSEKNKCALLMARADAHARSERYHAAKADTASAVNACLGEQSYKEAERRNRVMNGQAGAEAVLLAQRFSLSPGKPTLMEMRKEQVFSLAGKRKIGESGVGDKWIASHVEGPIYRVVLRRENKYSDKGAAPAEDIYALIVNLWTGFVKPEKGFSGQ